MTRSGAIAGGRFQGRSVEGFFQYSLLGLLTSGYLAVVGSGYLGALTIAVTASALLLRLLLVAGVFEIPFSDRWVTAVTVAYIGFYPLDYLYVSREFLPATVHLVLFLAVVKVLSSRTDRDYVYVLVIAFLELLAASVLSANLNYFVFLALFLLFAVATFASWEIRRSAGASSSMARSGWRRLQWRLAASTLFISLCVLSITGGLFFVLPRTARAAFEQFVPERFHITGFSDQVTLGQIGEIKRQATVLMRARIPDVEGPVHLKWRGTALGEFDGKKWYNSSGKGEALRVRGRLLLLADDDQRRRRGHRINYEVQLKAFASNVLFIAGRPEFLRIDSPLIIRTPADGLRLGFRTSRVLRYGVYSYLEDGTGARPVNVPPLSRKQRETYLGMPPLDPRIESLARLVTAGDRSQQDKARALETHLKTACGYTMELPEVEASDPIAHFLFERRQGHCEYFASAMAVMLRAVGIPSRVATGFQSGVYNPISGWHTIRASDAHSWVEAWLPGLGWTTFDPTPPDPSRAGPSLWSRLALLIDAADTFWQNWVLDYDLNRQLLLAARVDQSRRSFSLGWLNSASAGWGRLKDNAWAWLGHYGAGLSVGLIVVVAVVLAVPRLLWWLSGRLRARKVQRGEVEASDATVLYARALKLLKRRGIHKPPWLTPFEFARLMPVSDASVLLEQLTAAYNDLRFGGRIEAAPRMVALLGQLEGAASQRTPPALGKSEG